MRFLVNLPIAGKLALAFGLVLCTTGGLGAFAIQRLDAVNAAAAEVRDNRLPSTRVLGQVGQISERVRAYQSTALHVEDDSERRARDARTASAVAELRAALKECEPLVSRGEKERLAEAASRTWAAYDWLSTKLAELGAGQRQGGGRERASAFFIG